MRTSLVAMMCLLLVPACQNGASKSDPAKAAKAEAKPDAKADAKPDAKADAKAVRAVPPSAEAMEKAKAAGPLTQEEKDLIAAEPKDLSREDRIKRGYALRKKIMQKPDSPAAQQLEELRRLHEAGEIDIQLPANGNNPPPAESGLHLSTPTKTADDAKKPAK
ncbi:MAG: hypothetical protein ACPG4T_21015 [Nannocystaceae bacterium]